MGVLPPHFVDITRYPGEKRIIARNKITNVESSSSSRMEESHQVENARASNDLSNPDSNSIFIFMSPSFRIKNVSYPAYALPLIDLTKIKSPLLTQLQISDDWNILFLVRPGYNQLPICKRHCMHVTFAKICNLKELEKLVQI